MANAGSEDYVLGRTTAEHQRLVAQAQVWSPATRSALARAGLSAGMSALDVGCGTGASMRLMADVVGPSGRVTGLDADAALGAQALGVLKAQGPDIFAFVAGDVGAATSIDSEKFDLVFARLLLIHASDPVATLRRLWDWVKPGGVLLVMDYDLTALRTLSPHPVVSRAIALITEMFRALGKDVEVGTRMSERFRSAGLGAPDGCDVWSHIQLNSPGVGMVRAVLASLRAAGVAAGHVDAATMDAVDAQLGVIPAGEMFVRMPDMVATWKRRPVA